MNPNTKRSQTLRAKRKAQGLTEVRGIWAKPEDHAKLKRVVSMALEQAEFMRNYVAGLKKTSLK